MCRPAVWHMLQEGRHSGARRCFRDESGLSQAGHRGRKAEKKSLRGTKHIRCFSRERIRLAWPDLSVKGVEPGGWAMGRLWRLLGGRVLPSWTMELSLPWFKYCFSLGSNILPSLVALAVELSSSPLRLQDKVGSPQGPSSWASLHLAFWARSSSLSPSPFPPPPTPYYSPPGCCSKALQARWLKTTEVDPLSAGGQKSEIQVSAGPSEPPRNPSSRLPGSWWSSFPALQLHHASLCLCCHRAFSLWRNLCLNFPVLVRHQSQWIRAHSNNCILTWGHLQKPCFQIRSHSQVSGSRTSTDLFRGQISTHSMPLDLLDMLLYSLLGERGGE